LLPLGNDVFGPWLLQPRFGRQAASKFGLFSKQQPVRLHLLTVTSKLAKTLQIHQLRFAFTSYRSIEDSEIVVTSVDQAFSLFKFVFVLESSKFLASGKQVPV
jgi:hypothetical protein